MPKPEQIASLLPPNLEAKLTEFEEYAHAMGSPNQETAGALAGVERVTTSFLIACGVTYPGVGLNSVPTNHSDLDQESLTDILVQDEYAVAMLDVQYQAYRNLAVVAAGVAVAIGNENVINHGFELGKKIVTHRSHHSALAMADGTGLVLNKVCVADDMSLYERAHLVYRSTDLMPAKASLVIDAEGQQFDKLLGRMRLRDFVDVKATPYDSRSFIKGMGKRMKSVKTVANLATRLRDPSRSADVVEEAFDMLVPDVYMEITDNEAELIARNAAKMAAYIGKAGTKDKVIAADPRPKHMKFLATKLSHVSIGGERAQFQRDVRKISTKEKNRK